MQAWRSRWKCNNDGVKKIKWFIFGMDTEANQRIILWIYFSYVEFSASSIFLHFKIANSSDSVSTTSSIRNENPFNVAQKTIQKHSFLLHSFITNTNCSILWANKNPNLINGLFYGFSTNFCFSVFFVVFLSWKKFPLEKRFRLSVGTTGYKVLTKSIFIPGHPQEGWF